MILWRSAMAVGAPGTLTYTGIMGVASQRAAAVTGRFVGQLKAHGEDKSQDELDERLGIAQEL